MIGFGLICIGYVLFICQDSINLIKMYQTYPLFLFLLNFYLYQFYEKNIFKTYMRHSVRFYNYMSEIALFFFLFIMIKIILVLIHYNLHIPPIVSVAIHFAIYTMELCVYIYPEFNISNWNYSWALSLRSNSELETPKQFNEWRYQVSDIIPSLNRTIIENTPKESLPLFVVDNVSIYENQIVLVRKFKKFHQKSGFNYVLAKVLSFKEKKIEPVLGNSKQLIYYEIKLEEMLNPKITTMEVLSPRKFIIPAKICLGIEKENLNSLSHENMKEISEISERKRVAHLLFKSYQKFKQEFYWGSRFIKIKSSYIFKEPFAPKSLEFFNDNK